MTEGYSLVSAIHDKYDDTDDNLDAATLNTSIKIFVPKSGPASTTSGCLRLPRRLTLDHNNINVSGDISEICRLCESVEELDLTNNKLSDWTQVFQIVQGIAQLHFLNLTNNPLDDQTVPDTLETFPYMRDLVLNSTAVSWDTVAKLLPAFPHLKSLHLSLNFYTTVKLPEDQHHDHVTSLYLNNCGISEWADIQMLGRTFPNLKSLNVIETNISHLSEEKTYTEFSHLKTLNVGGTQIASSEEVEKFHRFPALTHLRMTGVPFMKDADEKERRRLIVAHLPNITHLNGSPISDTEHEDAERFYIRHYMKVAHKPARYEELVAKHGALDPLVHVDLTPDNYISLLVSYDGKTEVMDVYLHQTIWEFKIWLNKFTGLSPQETRLFYVEKLDGEFVRCEELKLRLKARRLLSLNMNPGDEIQIDKQTVVKK